MIGGVDTVLVRSTVVIVDDDDLRVERSSGQLVEKARSASSR